MGSFRGMYMKETVISIVGPTAVGKSLLGIEMAKRFNGEVISGDSTQVYTGMDIGTAKVTKEEMDGITHHMIDIISPDESFSVADFQLHAKKCIDDVLRRDKLPILVGGSGLYIDVSRNQEIAQEYASHAVKGASARLGQVGRVSGDEIDTTPVVLSGRLNVTRQMRVGRFEIVRGGAVDLERGILPANWDDNPLLRRVLEERFEILDLRGMSSNGLNLNTDRILVIHENAGDDIIEWTNEVAQ